MEPVDPVAPVEPVDRLQRICSLARYAVVELETHPVNPEEYRFLTSGEIFQKIPDLRVARGFTACAQGSKFQPDSNLMA